MPKFFPKLCYNALFGIKYLVFRLFKAAQKYGSEILYDYKNLNGAAVRVPDNKTPAKAIKYYKRVPGVLSAEMDKRAYLM